MVKRLYGMHSVNQYSHATEEVATNKRLQGWVKKRNHNRIANHMSTAKRRHRFPVHLSRCLGGKLGISQLKSQGKAKESLQFIRKTEVPPPLNGCSP